MAIAKVTKKNDLIDIRNGEETIIENPKSGGTDTLCFKDVTDISSLKFSTSSSGEDLVISTDETNPIVTIKNYFSSDSSTSSSIKKIRLENNGSYTYYDILKDGLIKSGKNNFVPDKKGSIKGTVFSDEIIGTDGNDKIYTNGGNDTVIGSKGNDSIYANNGSEVFKFSIDALTDTTHKIYNSDSKDILELDDVIENKSLIKKGNDLIVNGVTLVDWFKQRAKGKELTKVKYNYNRVLDLSDGKTAVTMDYSDSTTGQKIQGVKEINSEIYLGTGDDKIYVNPDEKSTTYIRITRGSDFGNKTIYLNKDKGRTMLQFIDEDGNTGNGTFYADDGKKNFTCKKAGNDALISVHSEDGTTGTILIKDYFKSYHKVGLGTTLLDEYSKFFVKKDLYTSDYSNAKKGQTIKGTVYTDNIIGSDYNDKIYTSPLGNNLESVTGGKGNDTVYFGRGNNVFYFDNGDGNDVLNISKNTDSVLLRMQGDSENKSFERKGNDLIIKRNLEGTDDSVTLKNYFKQTEEHYKLASEGYMDEILNLEEYDELRTIKAPKGNKSATMNGTFLNDIIYGSNKNDKIYTNGGDDTVSAGKGNDTIHVKNEMVNLNFKQGDGSDTVYIQDKNSSVYLNFDGVPTFVAEISKNRKDLILNYTYDNGETKDKIIIKDFYANKIDISNIFIKTSDTSGSLVDKLGDDLQTIFIGSEKRSNKLTGTDFNDYFIGGDKNDTIISNSGNDTVWSKGGDDYIKLAGDNGSAKTIISHAGEGNDVIDISGFKNGLIYMETGDSDFNNDTKIYRDGKDIVVGKFSSGAYEYDYNGVFRDENSKMGVYYEPSFDISHSTITIKDYITDDYNPENPNVKLMIDGVDYSDSVYDIGNYVVMPNQKTTADAPHEANTNEHDDYVVVRNSYNNINTGSGWDIIKVDGGNNNIDGGTYLDGEGADGDTDTLIINNLAAGNNVKNIERIQVNCESEDNLYMFFNVDKDGNYAKENITIGNSNAVKNTINGTRFDSNGYIKTGTLIDKLPQEFYIADKYGCAANWIQIEGYMNIIAKNVSAFLATTTYDSVEDLIANGTKKEKDALFNIFKKRNTTNDKLEAGVDGISLRGGAGNDTYIVDTDNMKNMHFVINDTSGKKDILEIKNAEKEKVGILLNISLKTDKNGNIITKKGVPQYTINSENLSLIYNPDLDSSNIFENNIVDIEDYFGAGKIETIKTDNGVITKADIDKMAQNIANWLAENWYSCTDEAIANGKAKELAELITNAKSNQELSSTYSINDLNPLRECVVSWTTGDSFADFNDPFAIVNNKQSQELVQTFTNNTNWQQI